MTWWLWLLHLFARMRGRRAEGCAPRGDMEREMSKLISRTDGARNRKGDDSDEMLGCLCCAVVQESWSELRVAGVPLPQSRQESDVALGPPGVSQVPGCLCSDLIHKCLLLLASPLVTTPSLREYLSCHVTHAYTHTLTDPRRHR